MEKLNLQLKHEKIVRKTKRRKKIIKIRNVKKNKPKNKTFDRPKHNPKNIYNISPNQFNLEVGKEFTLFENQNGLIDFINRLDDHKKNLNIKKVIRVDFSNTLEIDYGAISFLLAKVNELKKINRKIEFWTILPTNEKALEIISDSGFKEYLRDFRGNKLENKSENFIVHVGTNKTRNEIVGKIIKKTVYHLINEETSYPPIYSMIQEICSNSVEWANPRKKNYMSNENWFIGVHYDDSSDNKSVTFMLTDVGIGIVKSLKVKSTDILKKHFKILKPHEILLKAYNKEYESLSGDLNRNKGLPIIKEKFFKKQILDLKVITNNVFLDFSNHENSKTLDIHLPGTFYYWTVNKQIIEQWKHKK